jgi:hypothetical protein
VEAYTPWQRRKRRAYLKFRAHFIDAGVQLLAMWGLALTYRRTAAWAWRLVWGRIEHSAHPPASRIPMCDPKGGPASHALPGTPTLIHAEPPVELTLLQLPVVQRKAA